MSETEIISLVVGVLRANPRAAVILGAVVMLVSLVGNGWQLVSKEKREALRVARPRLYMFFEVMASLSLLVVRAARVVKYAGKPRESLTDAGGPGTVRGEVREAPSVPPVVVDLAPGAEPYADRSGPRSAGFALASVAHFIAAAFLAFVVAGLVGCPMPSPDGCAPGTRRCHEDTPQVCSPGQRWTPADVTCTTVGAVCEMRSGIPACVRGDR